MNVELKKRSDIEIDKAAVNRLSKSLSLHPKTVEVLISRGIDDEESIRHFLKPDIGNMYDPFLLKDMDRAAKRLEEAIENDETIVVYGDYDADGICAAAILSLYLRSRGLNIYTHIPNRVGEGYGLNIGSIEKIIDSACPDLILTCDCGISGHAEVEYAMDLGVDVIVTDHHEVADSVPECIVVNPKQPDCKYPYKYLCGAGVALKLVEAMGGKESMQEYLDLACIATIADLVPLLDENRLIVQLGLKALEEHRNMGLKMLLDSQGLNGALTSADITFKIAPRINAAGRIGDAYRAFEMLTTDNVTVIAGILKEINEANNKRKQVCDALYDEAVADLAREDMVNNRSIILSHPSWEKGITGIVAARLTNDFKRPSFIMVQSGDGYYKGTCRSVDNINIYEALSAASDLLVEFGGHSGAAGFSIHESNIPLFKQRINDYLTAFPREYFLPSCTYDVELDEEDIKTPFIKELEKLEPTGNSFTKPLFKLSSSELTVSLCKNNINHTSITTKSGFQIFAFNYYKQNHYIMGGGIKDMVVELQCNVFNNKEYARGILREISPQYLFINDETAKAVYLKYTDIQASEAKANYRTYEKSEVCEIVGNDIFGTLVIAFDKKSYDDFNTQAGQNIIIRDYIYASVKNNYTRLIVAPDFDSNLMLANYRKIVLLEKPVSEKFITYLNERTNSEIFVPQKDDRARFVDSVDVSRLAMGKYYDFIRKNQEVSASNLYSYLKAMKNRIPEINLSQLMLCINVFNELGLVKIDDTKFKLTLMKGEKRELSESEVLSIVQQLKEKL